MAQPGRRNDGKKSRLINMIRKVNMNCPDCEGVLETIDFHGIKIDECGLPDDIVSALKWARAGFPDQAG